MAAMILPSRRVVQPQGPIAVDYGNPLARGLVFAINPSAGGVNLARSNWPSVNSDLVRSTSSSVLLSSGAANYSQSINNANGLTLFSILRSRDASQYLFSDGERSILSARNASNQGWTWSRYGAADIGGSRGNSTRQTFTLNGIAAYSEANSTIESFADVPVALRYVKSSGVISWFSNGRKSSNDTNGSTGGTVGGDLVFRRQGPYANNLQPYIDKTGLTLVFERALSDAEIAAISANPWQLFKPVERRIIIDLGAGGGGASQSVAFTLEGLSFFGAQTAGRTQSLAASLDGVSVTAAQTLQHSQSLAAGLDGVNFAASQQVAGAAGQTLAITLDGVTASANQTLQHGQSLTATLDGIAFDATQIKAGSNSQSLAVTLDGVTVAASQTATHPQALAVTLDGIAVDVVQSVRQTLDQSMAITLDDITASISQQGPQAFVDIDGFWERQWKKAADQAKRKETIEELEEQLEEIEEQIAEVKAAPIPKRPVRVQSAQIPPFEAQIKLIEKLIAQADRIRAEIEEEEDILLLL